MSLKAALILYTIREYCQDEANLDKSFEKISAIGYKAVQISGIGPIKIKRVKTLLHKHGLVCCGTHESLDNLENDLDSVIEKQKILGCSFAALGGPDSTFWKEGGAEELGKRLAKITEKLAKEGISFGFHNHHNEFVKYGGETFLSRLYKSAGNSLMAEIDVHWVQRGGGDPAHWIEKMGGRVPLIHFKDMILERNEEGKVEPLFAEVGEGNLNWERIVDACRRSGVQYCVVEQDEPRKDKDIFQSIELSYKNMKKMGIE